MCFGQYTFENAVIYSADEGLPSGTVYDVNQDSKGYIWIATEGGLVKFNGQAFKYFNSKNGLYENEVVRVSIDKMDRVWINSSGPVSYVEDDKIKIIDEEYNINLNLNFNVFHSQDSLIWLTYLENLYCFSNDTKEKIDLKALNKLVGPKRVLGEHRDTLYLNFGDLIVKYHNKEIRDSLRLSTGFALQNFKSRIYSFHWPYLLFTDTNGLNKYNFETNERQFIYPLSEPVNKIQVVGDNLFILTTHSFIIAKIDHNLNIISADKLFDDIITSNFYIDKEENLWVANYKSGLYFFPKLNENIQIFDCSHVCSNHIESILINGEKIYAGTDDNMILNIRQDTIIPFSLNLKNFKEINRILDMHALNEKEMLVSTDSGIITFSETAQRVLVYTNSKKLYCNDTLLVTSSSNRCYAGPLKNLLARKEGTALQKDLSKINFTQLSDNRTYSSIVDKKGDFWIGDVVKGLTKKTKYETTYFKEKSTIFNVSINKILELNSGIIAVATNGEGIVLIKDDDFFQIDKNKGLSGNICYNLFFEDGLLLAATNRGLSVITNLNFAKKTFSSEIYNKESGLPSNEVTGVAIYKNEAILSTKAGVAKVDLSVPNKKRDKPKVIIEEFYVNNETYDLNNNLNLEANQNNVLIKFSIPSFTKSSNTTYAYKLSGIDDNWIVTSSNDTHYSNLEPGDYTFKVKAGKESENQNNNSTTLLKFSIAPMFHQTLLFQYLMAFLSLFLLGGIFKYFIDKKRTEVLKNLVEVRTSELQIKMQDLAVANEKLSKSNKELEEFAYITSHDLQEPLTTINGFAKLLMKKTSQNNDGEFKKYIEIINDSSNRMKNLITDLLIYSRIGTNKVTELTDLNILIQEIESDMTNKISISHGIINYNNLPTIKCYKLELRLLFQNLISNALKFQNKTLNPIININFLEKENEYQFSVNDNGIGIDKNNIDKIFNIFQRLHTKQEYKGTGIGLSHCKKIVELHSGKIWVESKINVGSTFYFTISKTLTENN